MPTAQPIPAVKGNPILGSIRKFETDRISFLLENADTFGPICVFRIGPMRIVQVNDPALATEIIDGHHGDLSKGMIVSNIVGPAGAQGLFISEGEMHDHTRELLEPSVAPGAVEGWLAAIAASHRASIGAWPATATLNLRTATTAMGRDVAGHIFLGDAGALRAGTALGDVITSFHEHVDAVAGNPYSPPPAVPTPRNRRNRRDTKQFGEITRQLATSRRGDPTGDVLSTLTSLKTAGGQAISDEQLAAEFGTALLAHEIVGVVLAWTLAAVARDAALQEALSFEATNAPAGMPALAMPLVDRVVREGLRLYQPTAALLRQAKGPFEAGGYQVKKRDTIFVSPWVIHRQASIFANPEKFDPERWTDLSTPISTEAGYIPFGIGRRDCIGQHLAWAELHEAVAAVARTGRMVGVGPMPRPKAVFNIEPSAPLLVSWASR